MEAITGTRQALKESARTEAATVTWLLSEGGQPTSVAAGGRALTDGLCIHTGLQRLQSRVMVDEPLKKGCSQTEGQQKHVLCGPYRLSAARVPSVHRYVPYTGVAYDSLYFWLAGLQ